jgi:type I restriction enzyme M protein
VRDLTKLQTELQEKEAVLRQHAEREIALAKETAADLLRICADPLEARQHFTVVGRTEIEENEFNLNLPRYVDTFEPEEEILIEDAVEEFGMAQGKAQDAAQKLQALLRELQ